MSHPTLLLLFSALIVSAGCARTASRQANSDLGWPAQTRETKPWTRWWWPGNAVDPKDLSCEMQQFHDAGIGGVEITPIYGIQGADDREIKFLSPQWIEMLKHVAEYGRQLDVGVDMATCTGWPFGGPQVTQKDADAVIKLEDGKLVSRPSKMKVKRSAPGGEGWVLNPYSTRAIDDYLKSFDVLDSAGKSVVRAQFHDSFEYAGNWSDDVFDVFQKLHGYDLRHHAKELFGDGDADTVARVKSDYREALSAAHFAYIDQWVKWCHEHGYLARNQAHGAPGNLLDLYAAADIPETETFGSTPFKIPGFRRDPQDIDPKNEPRPMLSRFASSAAHVSGKRLASSETLTWLREHFKVALSMCKPEIDQMFLCGINHIFYHGTCYSPEDAAWPGWEFYASSEMNPRDTLWRNLPAMNAYIARCQSILQSGQPDNDVLLYWPVYDNWSSADGMDVRFRVHNAPGWLDRSVGGKLAQQLIDGGYAFDWVSDAQLAACANDRSTVRTAGGAKYAVILVPQVARMPVQTMEKLVELARGGAVVLMQGTLPQDVPGFGHLDEHRAKLKSILEELKPLSGGPGVRTLQVGKGVIELSDRAESLLKICEVRREPMADSGLQFIRRSFGQGHHYFIANLGDKPSDGWQTLAVHVESAVLMDPLTGEVGLASIRKSNTGAQVYLQIEPGQSMILRTFDSRNVAGNAWSYRQTAGAATQLVGRWKVEFIDGGPEVPEPFETEKLESWTSLGDDNAKRFAGIARYTLAFDAPAGATPDGWLLDLGDVRESARVTLNDQDLGVVWSLPMKLQIPASLLREKGNTLQIEVTNLPANRMRDLDQRAVNWRIFKEINYVNIHYQPFDAKNWPLTESGLLGPVTLTPMHRVEPK